MPLAALGDENYPTEGEAVLDIGVRLRSIREAESLVDHHLKRTSRHLVKQSTDHLVRSSPEEELGSKEVTDERLVVPAHRGDIEQASAVPASVTEG
jgi:hypothetical protein